ncbi:MAG: ABC-type antimicrobial peptide transport system, ATPase component [Anaerocolumna sp.]|jgi:ABC-type lipoprotein export system ATPase subunit|nr:ABC-type antimicrobial peptide transport system, ATPase component [Anaerocolumna sp.]
MKTKKELIRTETIDEIIENYPIAKDFFMNINLTDLPKNKTLEEALMTVSDVYFEEFGMERHWILYQFALFLDTFDQSSETVSGIDSITICGGHDKSGNPENIDLVISKGEIISIVGPTGSGKSRLLGDIECVAQNDTPTGRTILINGEIVSDDERFETEGKLVAQLSQNMNFVMDLSVKEFLEMHARSRFTKDPSVITTCFECANDLAGEKFSFHTKLTQLSGGQSRALMIADTAFMSTSPIVLIDEIENAGIDRKRAIKLLARNEKITLISTHDPLLALSADKRIVIKNGGIHKVITTTDIEKESLYSVEKLDQTLLTLRNQLRNGQLIYPIG